VDTDHKPRIFSTGPLHLFRYVDEQAFRYNNRVSKDAPVYDADTFELGLPQLTGKRLMFAEVTGGVGGTCHLNSGG